MDMYVIAIDQLFSFGDDNILEQFVQNNVQPMN